MMKEIHGGNIYKYKNKMYDFSANLNPLGMPESVKRAVIDNVEKYENYPDPFNRELIKELSVLHRVDEKRICPGNGAADVIFRIVLALKPEKALVVQPTFSEYEEALNVVNCNIERHFLDEKQGFMPSDDILDSIDSSLDMMFICNPNNPTGIPVSHELMVKIADKCKNCSVKLVVDECFTEFLEDEAVSLIEELEDYDNLIILKAFTKIYAMAGLRLGYCLCGDKTVADEICQTLQPWAVSTVASKAGVAAAKEVEFVENTRKYVSKERILLIGALKDAGYTVFDSKANYIFFKTEKNLKTLLEKEHIMIRSCSNYPSLDDRFYRIAVRNADENSYFIKVLKKISQIEKNRE